MADAHDHKSGNRGDVWKHFILCGVAHSLLQKHTKSRPFVYADSHCSLGKFTLPAHGEWERGIGLFYEKKWSLEDHCYFRIEQGAYDEDGSYLGSWRLVERLLAIENIQSDLRLFDTSDVVAQQLGSLPGFSHADGFDGILSGLSADLCFVDPAYSDNRERDWRRMKEISSRFSEQYSAALLWYPVFVSDRGIGDLRDAIIAEIRWSARGGNQVMRGCGVVAFGSASGVLHRMQTPLAQLAEALTGSLCLRDHSS